MTTGCQENYPDEYCSQYPPEGIPAKPRSIADWGTNFNITSNMMKKGKYISLFSSQMQVFTSTPTLCIHNMYAFHYLTLFSTNATFFPEPKVV